MTRPYFSSEYTRKEKQRKRRTREERRAEINAPRKKIKRGDQVRLNPGRIRKDADLWQAPVDAKIMAQLLANRKEVIEEYMAEVTGMTLGKAGGRNCWNVAVRLPDGKMMNAIFFEIELEKIEAQPG